jgi:hypothetical protein
MILEAVPALPDKRRNGHQVIKRASRHYAEALGTRVFARRRQGFAQAPICIIDRLFSLHIHT